MSVTHRRQWAEWMAMLSVLAAIYWLSAPIAQLQDWVNARALPSFRSIYAGHQWWLWWLLHGVIFIALLALGRARLPAASVSMISLATWLLIWTLPIGGVPALPVAPISSRTALITAATILLVAVPVISRLYTYYGWEWLPRRQASAPCLAPGFVLFTAMGSLLLLDYSAHGGRVAVVDAPARVELVQMQAVTMSMMLTTVLHPLAPTLLRQSMRWLNWLTSPHSGRIATRNAKVRRFVVWVLLAVWLASLAALKYGAGRWAAPWISEWVRLPFLVLTGWIAYRWVELGQARLAGTASAKARDADEQLKALRRPTGVLLGMLLAGTLASREFGQVLLCTVVLVVVATSCWLHLSVRSWPHRVTIALTMGAVVVLAIIYGPETFLKFLPLAHVQDRLQTMAAPFNANLDFLAVHRWLLLEAGLTGFGVSQVPWCGYVATLMENCVVGRGVSAQLHVDYAFVGLVAQRGTVWATIIAMGLVGWLLHMMQATVPKSAIGAYSPSLWRAWLVGVWCIALVVQAFFTMAGSLGFVVLTGVPLPLIAFSRVSLVTICVLLSLALSCEEE